MIFTEIEHAIKPLSRAEKWHLIEEIQRMLRAEEQDVRQSFTEQGAYPIYTPLGMEEGAATLQRYLDEGVLK